MPARTYVMCPPEHFTVSYAINPSVPVDLSEFRKAGGGPKCCTLELRPEKGRDTT